MKYCQHCGTQLEDSAKFCPNCGAAQPEVQPKPQATPEEKPEPISEENMIPYTESEDFKKLSDREKFDYYAKNDERFKDIYRVTKIQNIFNLVNILYLVPVFVCMFTPIGIFTGNNAPSGSTVPAGTIFTPLTLRAFARQAGNVTLAPNSNLNGIMPLMVFILAWVLFALIFVMSFAGFTKAYFVKTYRTENGPQLLMQNCKKSTNWIFGVGVSIVAFMAMLTQWISCDNNYAKAYERNGNRLFAFGEIAQIPGAFVAGLIVTILFVAVIVAGITVPRVLFAKKLDKYITK